MNFKKFLGLVLIFVLCATLFAVAACQPKEKNDKPTTVMNVSLNPEVEFVLDADGNVVTVNALNEEGNLVVSAEVFKNVEGKSAQDAVKLFVQVSKDTGYLVSGKVNSGENQLEISVSGNAEAANIFDQVKASVEKYLSSEKITATVTQAAEISKQQLQQLVAECETYLQEAEVKAMEYQQLVETLVASRKETQEMYSQELKTAYYEAKAFALEQAKLQVVRDQLGKLQQIAFDGVNKAYSQACEALEKARFDNLVSEESAYQKALANVRVKKTEYLKFRNEVSQMEESSVTSVVLAQLDALQSALELAESTLLSAGETANASINTAKTALNAAYVAISETIKSVDTNSIVEEISQKQTEALNEFFTQFETEYAQTIAAAKKDWNDMEQSLKQTQQ